jgi:hypothetical protein
MPFLGTIYLREQMPRAIIPDDRPAISNETREAIESAFFDWSGDAQLVCGLGDPVDLFVSFLPIFAKLVSAESEMPRSD